MQIPQVGSSYLMAPVEIHEQPASSNVAIPESRKLRPENGCVPGYALEGTILSTCNRLGVYAAVESGDRDEQAVPDYLVLVTSIPNHVAFELALPSVAASGPGWLRSLASVVIAFVGVHLIMAHSQHGLLSGS